MSTRTLLSVLSASLLCTKVERRSRSSREEATRAGATRAGATAPLALCVTVFIRKVVTRHHLELRLHLQYFTLSGTSIKSVRLSSI